MSEANWIVVDGDEVVYRCKDRHEAIGWLKCYGEHVGGEMVLATIDDPDKSSRGDRRMTPEEMQAYKEKMREAMEGGAVDE